MDKMISTIKSFPATFSLRPMLDHPSPAPPAPLIGEARTRAQLEGASSYIYRRTEEGELMAHVFSPANHAPQTSEVPLLICLHGGMWDHSSPTQFVPYCHHFASRGMVAVTLEYRVFDKHRTGPAEAVEDVREALIIMRENAADLGIDPAKVVLMGAASGAHLALRTVLQKDTLAAEAKGFRPDALVLINPISDTGKKGIAGERFRDGKEAEVQSPVGFLPQKNLPPCLILHGGADRVVPVAQSVRLAKLYKKKANVCEFLELSGENHSFFNFNVNERGYRLAIGAADHFLAQKGFIEPQMDEPDEGYDF